MILHIITGLGVGGAELMLMRLIDSHHGHEHYKHKVISLTNMGPVGRQLQVSGIEVCALGMRSPLDAPRVLWQLMQLIRTFQPDIIQTWMYHADLLGGLAARFMGNKNVVWGVRTTDVRAGGSIITTLVRRICAWLSHSIPKIIICAAEASRKAHVDLGYDSSRMKVIPNGFDLSKLVATVNQRQAVRTECDFQENELVVGSLGRFAPVKGQGDFVSAAGKLAQRYPNVRFMMVGHNLDVNNKTLTQWIANTGYANRFALLGERSDVPACLSAMDIFCLHSRTEGFPNVLGEAMAMGLPCVTTDVGDAAFLLGDTGMVVPKEDSIALAQGVEKLLVLSSKERTLLGQKAKQRIHDEFMFTRSRELFEVIYNELLKRDVS